MNQFKTQLSARYLREPVLLAAPILVVLAIGHVGTYIDTGDAYSVNQWAHVVSTVFFLGPCAGAGAAWSISRLQHARLFDRPWARHRVTIYLDAVWVSTAAALAVIALTGLLNVGFIAPPIALVILAFLAIVQMVALGALLGRFLPGVYSAPLTLLAGYLWMVMPMAFEPLWLRNLNGHWPVCCSVEYQPSIRDLAAVAVVAAGLALVAIILASKFNAVRAVSAAAVAVACATGAAYVAAPVGIDPMQVRADGLTCILLDDNGANLCLFSEHEPQRQTAEDAYRSALDAWPGADSLKDTVFTESISVSGEERRVKFGYSIPMGSAIAEYAQAVLPPEPTCREDEADETSEIRYTAVSAMVARATGELPDAQAEDIPSEAFSQIQQVMAYDDDAFAQWFVATADVVDQCELDDTES